MVALDFTLTVEAIAAYLGALRSGLPLLVVEAGQLAENSRMRRIWQPDLHIRDDCGTLVLDIAPPGTAGDLPAPHEDLQLLLSTSGSTGDPKLVRLSGKNITSNAEAIAQYLNLSPKDCAATTLPFYYSYGLSVLNSYLAAGASLFLSERSVSDPDFWRDARDHDVTSLALVPHQFELLEHGNFAGTELPKLRYITQAGGKLAPTSVRHFEQLGRNAGWQLFVMYGQTEAAPRISYVPPEDLATSQDTIGRPIPGGRIWLADENGAEIIATNTPGELVYEGPNVMMGYGEIRPDLARGHDHDNLRTGDIAERTEAGYFRIVGRLKRFVKLFGLRLSLDQIETLLRDKGIVVHAVSIEDQLVLLHRDPEQGLAACETVAAHYGLPEDTLCAGHLDALPLLSSGKPDQKALLEIAQDRLDALAAEKAAAQGSEKIRPIMARATRSVVVKDTDSFTSLGGDSLSYLQLQMFLEERVGTAPNGWENMPITQLETLLQAAGDQAHDGKRIVGTDMILRIVAICAVVTQPASDYNVYGGAWALILLMGFTSGRFSLPQIVSGQPFGYIARMLYPIIPFYYLILGLYGLLRDDVPLSYVLLVGNYEPWTGGSLLVVYWFVNLYAQLILALALISAVPYLRDRLAARPWASMAKLLAGLLGMIAVLIWLNGGPGGDNLPYHPQRGFIAGLSMFCFGWLLQRMGSPLSRFATVLMGATLLGLLTQLDMTIQVAMVLAAAALLLGTMPHIRLPVRLARGLSNLAGATLFVYLLHEVVVFAIHKLTHNQLIATAASLVLSFALALITRALFDILEAWYRNRVGQHSMQPS